MNTVRRRLRSEESALIEAMICGLPNERELVEFMKEAVVEELKGGMGSLRFVLLSQVERRLGKQLCEGSFADEDGIPVLVTINLDQDGVMFELDVFKADHSPLKRFPKQDQVVVRDINVRSGHVH